VMPGVEGREPERVWVAFLTCGLEQSSFPYLETSTGLQRASETENTYCFGSRLTFCSELGIWGW
jgi:hypothetical protein